MREIKVGQSYYFNNGQVEILKIETDDFVLVKGDNNIHTEINGSCFCAACQIGGILGAPITHKCSDADEIIEEVLDDISEKNIFWVNVKHLQDKPFEYKKWEKITEENNKLCDEIKEKHKEKLEVFKAVKELHEKREELIKNAEENQEKLNTIISNLSAAEEKKIVLDNIPEIKISNSNLKISTSVILDFMKDSKKLECLEAGGVDNWEWYSESLPDCEDCDEYFSNQALEELSRYVKKES